VSEVFFYHLGGGASVPSPREVREGRFLRVRGERINSAISAGG